MRSRDWGLSQQERYADALDPASAPLDERLLPHFLRFVQGYAELLNFHESDGVRGDWRPMLDSDVSFLLAEMSEDDPGQAFKISRLARQARKERQGELDLLQQLYQGMRRIDGWYRRAYQIHALHACDVAGQLTQALDKIIQKALLPLRDAMLKLPPQRASWLAHWRAWSEADRQSGQWDDRSPPWIREGGGEPPPPDRYLYTADLAALERANGQLLTAGKVLRGLALEYLERSLHDKQDHPAHTTLLIGFLQLLETLKSDLNGYTERHLEFYYRSVLQLAPRGGQADAVYVMLQLAPAFPSWTLPAGSLLTAGKDGAGKDIVYATERELVATQGRVAALSNLYLQLEGEPAWITRALAAPQADSQDGRGAPLLAPEQGWPVFSRLEQARFAAATPLDADLGLFITSPLLALGSGRRRVRIGLVMDAANVSALRQQLQKRMQAVGCRLDEDKVVQQGLLLSAATAAGWQAVRHLRVALRQLEDGKWALDLRFTLMPGHPALCRSEAAGGAPPGPWPCLKLLLNPQADIYLLTVFRQAQIQRCQVQVAVHGLAGIKLRGDLGPLAADGPFLPFGVQALCGARVELAHPELAVEGLQRVALGLSWVNLLNGAASLEAYYAGYGQPFGSAQFQLALARYDGVEWVAQAGQPLFAAPTGKGAEQAWSSRLVWQAPARGWRCLPAGPLSAGQPACGALRLELAAPQYGFGSGLYPALATQQAMSNAALIIKKKAPLPLLRPALMPQARLLECDYEAQEDVQLAGREVADDEARLHYLYPFGSCPIGDGHASCLLADDDQPGRLYLGLAGTRPGESLVLHFQFRERSAQDGYLWERGGPSKVQPELRWRYLSGDHWRDLPEAAVESSTRAFSHSGLVTLYLPPDISSTHRVMPAGLHWIEVSANAAALPAMAVGIRPHGVRALRRDGPGAELAPGSISALQKKVPAVRAVAQPYPSVGGSAAETVREFRARVSERLRHKQRASQPSDYEQLVLAQFPSLRQAKCVNWNNSAPFEPPLPDNVRPQPGEVMLAVVPGGPLPQGLAPLPLYVLQDIADVLLPHMSESVRRLHIRDPRQEMLQVFVNVDFKPGLAADAQIQRLQRAISDWLAPWLGDPLAPLQLGCQVVQCHQLARFISEQPAVTNLSRVALLHTYFDGERHHARRYDATGAARLSTPWSVFVPAARHMIGLDSSHDPQPGIAALGTGTTLVVGALSEGQWRAGDVEVQS